MNTDLISIIMPVRNGLPYLSECLESIINQSYTNWELLVVNDNSIDNTQKVLESFKVRDPRIKPIQNNGSGIIDALVQGYTQSTGTFITRMDADDIMPTDKLKSLLQLLLESPRAEVATGHVKYISESGVKQGYKLYEEWLNQLCSQNSHFDEIYKECVIPSPCWMMRKEQFEEIGGFEASQYPEDYDLCFRMYEHGLSTISSDKILHLWRDHSSRTSRNDSNYADNRFLDIKLEYFLKIEVPKIANLAIIGAGKKGKKVAQFLVNNNIDFTWLTNNPKKIGINIYNKILADYKTFDIQQMELNCLITIANKEEQAEAKIKLQGISKVNQYWFC